MRDELIATAAGSAVEELRAKNRHKRPAASKAFRSAIKRVAAALP